MLALCLLPAQCAGEKKLFAISDFAVGHRGAPLQFPEHTAPSYAAASLMGAGLVECDVTFSSDLELVCRHAQCDLHTTTDVVTRPELNAKCTTPWAPGVAPTCCTSDFTLLEIKTLCAKMDSSGDVNSETALGKIHPHFTRCKPYVCWPFLTSLLYNRVCIWRYC